MVRACEKQEEKNTNMRSIAVPYCTHPVVHIIHQLFELLSMVPVRLRTFMTCDLRDMSLMQQVP